MGLENNFIETNKISKSTSGDLYRPPALRNHEANKCDVVTGARSSSNTETKVTTFLASSTSISCNNSPIHRNDNVSISNITPSTQKTTVYDSQQHVDEEQNQSQRQQQTRRERRPDRAVYIPRARRSQTTPPNTATTPIQPLVSPQEQPTQLLSLAPTTSHTSRSLNQQLAITLDDTTTASVNQKPSSKADEVGKINSGGNFNSTISNNSTKATQQLKKKEKLSKETKESQEQRREQRLLRKISPVSTQHILMYKKNENLNDGSINIISNDDGDEITNQPFIASTEQIKQPSSLINIVNNFNELNDNLINLSKSVNCDSCEELILNKERQSSADTTKTSEIEYLEKKQSQFLCRTAQSVEINCKATTNNTSAVHNVTTENIIVNNINMKTMPKLTMKTKPNKLNDEGINDSNLTNLRIEDIALQRSPTKYDAEQQELQRASKEINRSNRRIIKQTFTSDVLLIPDYVNEDSEIQSEVAEGSNKLICTPYATAQIESNTDEEEEMEDDWENMYNDSGDCLDPKIMRELTTSVGKCKIELPKMDYKSYLTKQSILNEEEFPHVLEVSNFPVEFRTQDLLMTFSQYKESGFDIKWVDDTHALAVFSSARIAAEVLTMGHPFVVLKPLAEATVESRLKAKKCAASLQPYRPRPETCPALARRLVTGALGVRLKTAAAERENEKRVLREAKERKLLAAKQRDEVWES